MSIFKGLHLTQLFRPFFPIALNRMMDISDITLVTMSGLIVVVSSAIIIAVNYRRLPCFNRWRVEEVEDVVHVIQEDGQQDGQQSGPQSRPQARTQAPQQTPQQAPQDWVIRNNVINGVKKV
jgi:hypothetical protein